MTMRPMDVGLPIGVMRGNLACLIDFGKKNYNYYNFCYCEQI